MKKLSEHKAEVFAVAIDGEGTIGWSKTGNSYTIHVQLFNTGFEFIRPWAEFFGDDARLYIRPVRGNMRKPLYILSITGERAFYVLDQLVPYLRNKPKHARSAMNLHLAQQFTLYDLSNKNKVLREKYANELTRLNVEFGHGQYKKSVGEIAA